jgi:glucose uptake protein GlcU
MIHHPALLASGQLATLGAAAVATDWNPILMALVGILGLAVPSIIGIFMAKINAESKRQTDELTKIHVAVNSSKTALDNKISDLTAQVLEISKANATLVQKLAENDLKEKVTALVAKEESRTS